MKCSRHVVVRFAIDSPQIHVSSKQGECLHDVSVPKGVEPFHSQVQVADGNAQDDQAIIRILHKSSLICR